MTRSIPTEYQFRVRGLAVQMDRPLRGWTPSLNPLSGQCHRPHDASASGHSAYQSLSTCLTDSVGGDVPD